jgi:hypothetical protein
LDSRVKDGLGGAWFQPLVEAQNCSWKILTARTENPERQVSTAEVGIEFSGSSQLQRPGDRCQYSKKGCCLQATKKLKKHGFPEE